MSHRQTDPDFGMHDCCKFQLVSSHRFVECFVDQAFDKTNRVESQYAEIATVAKHIKDPDRDHDL